MSKFTKKLDPPKNPDAPASQRLTWAIFCAGGGDVRPLNLTYRQAIEMLDALNAEKEAKSLVKT